MGGGNPNQEFGFGRGEGGGHALLHVGVFDQALWTLLWFPTGPNHVLEHPGSWILGVRPVALVGKHILSPFLTPFRSLK